MKRVPKSCLVLNSTNVRPIHLHYVSSPVAYLPIIESTFHPYIQSSASHSDGMVDESPAVFGHRDGC